MTVLAPGNYLIELEFTRPADKGTLTSALRQMGFDHITGDESAVTAIGALPLLSLAKPAAAPAPAPKLPSLSSLSSLVSKSVALPPPPAPLPIPKPAAAPVPLPSLSSLVSPSFVAQSVSLPVPPPPPAPLPIPKPAAAPVPLPSLSSLVSPSFLAQSVSLPVPPPPPPVVAPLPKLSSIAPSFVAKVVAMPAPKPAVTAPLPKLSSLPSGFVSKVVSMPAPTTKTTSPPGFLGSLFGSPSGAATPAAPIDPNSVNNLSTGQQAAQAAADEAARQAALYQAQQAQMQAQLQALNAQAQVDPNAAAQAQQLQQQLQQQALQAQALQAQADQMAQQAGGGGGGGGGGDPFGPAGPSDDPFAAAAAPPWDPYADQQQYQDPSQMQQAQPAAAAVSPTTDDLSQVKNPNTGLFIVDMWKHWAEWGSPFAQGAPQVSGEDDSPYKFRFIARLTKPLSIDDKPGMKWSYVRKLSLDPFGDLNFNLRPFPLRRGASYELRFMGRDKSLPSREDVKNALVSMGFAPRKLSVMKRNMRVPGRSGAGVTLWYGIGTWGRGDSVVNTGDPLFFFDTKEITS